MKKISRELATYIVAGVATTLVDWVLTIILDAWLSPTVSNVIAISVSIIFAYIVNSRWVFETKPEGIKQELKLLSEFVGTRVFSSIIQILSIFVLVEKLGFNHLFIKAMANIFVIVFNYIISKIWIFKK
ncbi:MAG: GtrA family protein [Eubacteriales bacterium]|nr:GtrA family protein [Eubacteriales bacterium]